MSRRFLVALLALFVAASLAADPELPQRLPLTGADWKVFHLNPSECEWDAWTGAFKKDAPLDPLKTWPPVVHGAIPAAVPGCVQEDCRRAGLIPDPYVGLNSLSCEWTSDRDWVYTREFAVPAALKGAEARLHFEGVDYECIVYLNGRRLGVHKGMYDPFEFPVADALAWGDVNRLLIVVLHKPPMEAQIGWTGRVAEWKARFAYKWDFCTRLVPLGIYDDVWIDFTGPARVADLRVIPVLSGDRTSAVVKIEATVEAAAGIAGVAVDAAVMTNVDAASGGDRLNVRYDDLIKAPLARDFRLAPGRQTLSYEVPVPKPKLWWPNGHGPQVLNHVVFTLRGAGGAMLDARGVRFGFRTLRAVPNDDAPKDALPYTIEINGKRIFLKGWNWCPADQLYGRVTDARYERLLRLAREANCNFLRVWGGGLIEKEMFFDLCDRYGILVWQEFIQSSSGIDNEPSKAPPYLAYIEDQARKIVPRRRNHPSLVIWCGGNELMEPRYKPLKMDHPTNGVFRKVLAELDPERIFLPTSPSGPRFDCRPGSPDTRAKWKDSMHDVHGEWKYEGVEYQYVHFNLVEPLFHSEFGVEGVTNLADALRIAPKEKLWPPDATNPVWTHHGAWWIQDKVVEDIWGPVGDLETFIRCAQFIQAEGLRYSVEANRRRKFRTSGCAPWQFNEPWPNLGCTNAVSYFMEPRPAYWWVRKAYEPLHVSLRHDGLAQRKKPEYAAQAWVNNSLEARSGLKLEIVLSDLAGKKLHEQSADVKIGEDAAAPVADVAWKLPEGFRGIFVVSLKLKAGDVVVSENVYLHSTEPDPTLAPLLQAPKTKVVTTTPNDHTIRLVNAGPAWALGVWIDLPGAYLSDNDLFLAPGEGATVQVEDGDAGKAQVGWWNAE